MRASRVGFAEADFQSVVLSLPRHWHAFFLVGFLMACATTPMVAADPFEALDNFRSRMFQEQALRIARQALRAWVSGKAPTLPAETLHSGLLQQAGVFVSIEAPGHRVRGCRGTLFPRTSRLVDELLANVREAALRDPLHPRVERRELEEVRLVLCIPGSATQVWPGEQWDARLYGLLVSAGERAAVMLPWEAPDSESQLQWGRRRAGIADRAAVRLLRFPAVRFAEPVPNHPQGRNS